MTHKIYFLLLLCIPMLGIGQNNIQLSIANDHVSKMQEQWELSSRDVLELSLSSMHSDKTTGITHIYLNQQFNGIDIHNAIVNVHLDSKNRVFHSSHRLIPDIVEKINAQRPALSEVEALKYGMDHLGITYRSIPALKESIDKKAYIFEKGSISYNDIPVKLKYTLDDKNNLRLSWDIAINEVGGTDFWNLRIDALTGELIEKDSWTVHCSFPSAHESQLNHYCEEHIVKASKTLGTDFSSRKKSVGDGAAYNVFELPLAHPDEGPRSIVEEPADTEASPFGWHDTDGADGPEFTIPRGNNVNAILDRNGDFTSDGNEPNGGTELLFDFPFDENAEPFENKDAGTVNLFYMTNMMHDIAFHYGFDGPAGNFQDNPYGMGGIGGDHVNALGQFGGDDPTQFTPLAINNANFSTPADGIPATMRMYLWDKAIAGGDLLTINAPSSVEGTIQTTTTADFGVPVDENPVTGEVIIVDDGTSDGSKGCFPLVNGSEVDGNIALIDRGDCDFSDKIYKAQQAGAIGVIICNYEDNYVNMAGGDFANEVQIPAVFITASDCQRIRIWAGDGLVATLQSPPIPGPDSLAGDFANGIIAHEYGHGISNRLTGGSANSNCLGNEEQMGEGWSDFFQFVTTTKIDDTGNGPKYVGNYVLRSDSRGFGDRIYPYSTDFAVNPSTYADVTRVSVPHGVGSVWASMLWDMYWAFIDTYGYDPDLLYGQGGNNMAIRLVMEGMKLQPCRPGFIDGRDAILKADSILNNAANQCLIWEVFARRGLGINADQVDPNSRLDPVESYDTRPTCIEELKISKSVTPLVEAGDIVEVEISGVNHLTKTATNVILSDEIPDGMQYVPGSANLPPQINGNLLQWELGDLGTEDTYEIKYDLMTDDALFSVSLFYDDMESGDGNWDFLDIENFFIWSLDSEFSNSGFWSWAVANIPEENEQVLFLRDPVELQGDLPILRFWHQYETEPWFDGGIIEISTDGGGTYEDLGPYIFRNPYNGEIKGNAFGTRKPAFWGDSNGWIESYVDLSRWAGESVIIRFHFASDADVGGRGWYVDDVELMDAHNYNSEACISSDDETPICTEASGYGTIVQPGLPTDIEKVNAEWVFRASPNPVDKQLILQVHSEAISNLQIDLFNVTGQSLFTNNIVVAPGQQNHLIDVSDLQPGFYTLTVVDARKGIRQTQKIVVH